MGVSTIRRMSAQAVTIAWLVSLLAAVPAAAQVQSVEAKPQNIEHPADAEAVLTEIEHKVAGWEDYRVRGDNVVKGKHSRYTVYFKMPDLVRVDCREGQVTLQADGTVRGRLGHGLFGAISRGISRNDKRLKDDEGNAFYENHLPAVIARIRKRVRDGARLEAQDCNETYRLSVVTSAVTWSYEFDKKTGELITDSRTVDGTEVESTHYTDYKINTHLAAGLFRF